MAKAVFSDHAALKACMEEFREALSTGTGPSDPLMLKQRVRFARLFATHVIAEKAYVQAWAERGAAQEKAVADEYQRRIASLQQDYSAHVGRWTPAILQLDWRGYGAAVTALRHRFLSLIAWEEENIS